MFCVRFNAITSNSNPMGIKINAIIDKNYGMHGSIIMISYIKKFKIWFQENVVDYFKLKLN